MAEPRTTWQRIGLTRGKAALVGVLGVVLVGVVYIQFGPSDEEEIAVAAVDESRPQQTVSTATQAPQESTAISAASADTSEPAIAAVFDQNQWKSPPLGSVIGYDPFALPEAFPRRATLGSQSPDGNVASSGSESGQLTETIEQLQMELETLQQRGVHVIVRGRDQYVAIIGDRMLNVGDEINGFTITSIDPDGVRVEGKVNQ